MLKLLFRVIIPIAITAVLVYFFFSIEPDKTYTWWQGAFHGAWVVPNWIVSWFKDGYYVKAPMHTAAYNVWWWIFCIWMCLGWITAIFVAFKKS